MDFLHSFFPTLYLVSSSLSRLALKSAFHLLEDSEVLELNWCHHLSGFSLLGAVWKEKIIDLLACLGHVFSLSTTPPLYLYLSLFLSCACLPPSINPSLFIYGYDATFPVICCSHIVGLLMSSWYLFFLPSFLFSFFSSFQKWTCNAKTIKLVSDKTRASRCLVGPCHHKDVVG